jgi:predicted nucleic acid-binding protein
VIVLDTTVLVYAVGAEHPLREPCRRIVKAVTEGRVAATTTVEVVQEFVHVANRRADRRRVVTAGRRYAALLAPLLVATSDDLEQALSLYERHRELGALDALLAATAMRSDAAALVSADRQFGTVGGLPWVDPAGNDLEALFA